MKLNGELKGWEYHGTGVFRYNMDAIVALSGKNVYIQVNLLKDEAVEISDDNYIDDVWYLIAEAELVAMKKHYFKEQLEEILK